MTFATYNYQSFSFALEEPELDRWSQHGPHPGEPAPDFQLDDLDGNPLRLSLLRGKPVVLEFGSYSCPIFSDRVPEMERIAREHPEAEFLVIAIREAHPGEITCAHTTLTQKRQAARRLAIEEGIRRRVLVDDLEGTVHRAYGGGWNPVYVIDADGRVATRRAWNHPDEVAQALSALADGGSPPATESVEMAQLPTRGAIGLRLLERGGKQALLDFYHSAPAPLKKRLRESPSQAVSTIIDQEEQ
jgi:AhpC/TSA family